MWVDVTDEHVETKIIRGLREGDSEAWDALCRRFERRLWQYISRLIGNDSNAVADVYQETLLAVAASGRRIDSETTLWPWLAKIGHNQVALHWRKHYRLPSACADTDKILEFRDVDPEAVLARVEANERVRILLSQMDPDHVSILTAKYMEGKSIAEIVAIFGGSTESVRSRLARARRDFRERYQRVMAGCE